MGRRENPFKGRRPPAALNVARALWGERRFDEAIRKFNQAVRESPNDPVVLVEAARAIGARYQIGRSQGLLQRALRLAPRRAEVQHAVGEAYLALGRTDEAEACFRRACLLASTPSAQLELARLCERRHALDDAAELVARILRAEPLAIPALLLRARIERRRGELEKARSTLRQIVTGGGRHPKLLAQAYGELCILLDASAEYDAAWDAILECKRILLALEEAAWGAAQFVLARCRRMVEALTRGHFERWCSNPDGTAPRRLALLTGFPRTGTTLLEQVLDSHPQVVSSEEREVFSAETFPQLGAGCPADAPIAQLLDGLSGEQLARARQQYLDAIEELLGEAIGARVHVDKNPAMNLMIPPMRRVFPELKLIVALRDPRDVIASCFLRYLPINPVSVCFLTLERTVDRFDLDMGAWLKIREMTDEWVEVRYEQLVADLRRETSRVLDLLGLPWDESVLSYREHGEHKLVSSPSYEEVARPIFTTSVGRWQNYERHMAPALDRLAPLIKALGYEAS